MVWVEYLTVMTWWMRERRLKFLDMLTPRLFTLSLGVEVIFLTQL